MIIRTKIRIGQWGRKWSFFFILERECSFSLDLRAIGPSEFFEARRKAVIRGKGNAWASDLRIFDILREVGVLSYLKLDFI